MNIKLSDECCSQSNHRCKPIRQNNNMVRIWGIMLHHNTQIRTLYIVKNVFALQVIIAE